MKTFLVILIAVIMLTATIRPTWAAEDALDLTSLSLEELMEIEVDFVVSASRYIQKVQEAPAAVTVINSEEIRRYGYQTLDDVIRSIIGFSVTYDRTYSYTGVRGFGLPGDYNARILLLIDGHRINEKISDSFFSDWGLGLDLGTVSRIEVVKGPGSALYGSNAMLAVINIVTRAPSEEPGFETGLILGEPGLTVSSARIRGKTGSISYSLDLQRVWRKGHETLYFPEFADPNVIDYDGDGNAEYTGYTRNSDGEEAVSLRARLETGGLSVTGFFADWEKTVPNATFDTLFDTGLEIINEGSYYLDLRYKGQLGDTFHWEVGATVDKYWYEGDYPYAYDYWYPNNDTWLNPPYTIFKDDQKTAWQGVEAGADYTGLAGHRIIFGARYETIDVDLESYDVDPAFVYEDDEFSYYNISAYVQDEISLAESLTLILGLNQSVYDEGVYRGDVNRINPRFGLLYGMGPSTVFKLLYGEAFRAPNMFELLYDDDGDTQIENPDLEAEVLKTAEAILWHELGRDWGFKASLYQTRFEKLISAVEYDPVGDPGVIQYQNTDEVQSQGVEVEIRKHPSKDLSGYLAVALQKTENRETDLELPNSPRQMINAGVSVPLSGDKVYLSIDAHYVGQVKTKGLSLKLDPHLVTNATLSNRGLAEGLDLSLTVRNLLDASYYHPGSSESFSNAQERIKQDSRQFGINMTYRF